MICYIFLGDDIHQYYRFWYAKWFEVKKKIKSTREEFILATTQFYNIALNWIELSLCVLIRYTGCMSDIKRIGNLVVLNSI